jgi:TP901 family phage tail tape measure protein
MARIELNIVALGDFTSVNAQIKSLQTQIGLLNKSVAGVGLGSALAKDLAAAQAAFNSTMLSTGQFTQTTVKMTAETEKFGAALMSGKLKLSEYFNIITGKAGQSAAAMKALAIEQVKLQESVVMSDPTKRGIFSVYTPTQINAITASTKLATMQQNLYNLALEKSSLALVTWGKNTQWAGRQLTVGLTMPMVMFGAVATKSFKDTNTELTRLQRLYGVGLVAPSADQINKISSQVIDLGKKLATSMGTAQKDTAATAADFAAIGRTGDDLLTATEQAMRLSKLGSIDAHQAFTGIMTLQNTFKVGSKDLAEGVNFMTAIQKQTALNLNDITDAFPRIGPIVKQLGGTYKDTAVMMLAMKEAGVPAAQAANAIKSAMASLISPTTAAKDMFAKFNINLGQIATSTGGNPVKMIFALQQALQGIAPLAREQLIEKLFGKFQFARVTALLDNLGKAGSQTQLGFKIAGASATELATLIDQEMKIATESVTGKWSRAIEGFKATIYPVGQKFLEMGTMILNFANKIGKAFSSLPSPIKTVLGIFAGGAALAGPVIMLTGLLANFAGYILKAFINLKQLITGGKTFKELLTPEIIASQNAAQLFGSEIAKDVEAVDLLAAAIEKLTTSLTAMQAGLTASTADAATAAASTMALANTNMSSTRGIYGQMTVAEAQARAAAGDAGFAGRYKTGAASPNNLPFKTLAQDETVLSKPTSGVFAIRGINEKLASEEGVAVEEYIKAMTDATGETEAYALKFKTSSTQFLEALTKMVDDEGRILLTQEDALKINEQINIEYEKELLKMKTVNDVNNPIASVSSRVMAQNYALSSNPAAMQKFWNQFNLSSSNVFDQRNRAGGAGAWIGGAEGFARQQVALTGAGNVQFVHAMNEEFKANEARIIESMRETARNAGVAFDETLVPQIQAGLEALPNEVKAIINESFAGLPALVEKDAVTVAMAWEEGMVAAIAKSEVPISEAVREELIALAIAGAPEAELAGMTLGEAFMAGQAKAMGVVGPQRELPGILRGRAGGTSGRMGGMGVGMVAMMGGSMLSGKGGMAGTAGSVLSNVGMASMIGMFLPESIPLMPILAGVAAVTLLYKAVEHLSEVEKKHKAEAEADWKISADAASFYGNSIDAATKAFGQFTSVVQGAASVVSASDVQLANFVDMVNKLPKDNPLSLVFQQLTDETNPAKIKKIIQEYVNLQVAMGAIKPEQAQGFIDLLLKATGHGTSIGNILPETKTQLEAVSAALKETKNDTEKFQSTFMSSMSLVAGASSQTELESRLQAVIAGLGDASLGVDMLKQHFISMGKEGAAQLQTLQALLALHFSSQGIMEIMALLSAGGSVTATDPKTGKAKTEQQMIAELAASAFTASNSTNAKTKSLDSANAKIGSQNDKYKAQIDLLTKQKNKLDDALKTQQAITAELKRQQDFMVSQADLEGQIRVAIASGDYLKANLLQMQKNSGITDYANQNATNALQNQIDALDKQIKNYQQAMTDNQTAIDKNTKAIDTLNKDGVKVGSINWGDLVKALGILPQTATKGQIAKSVVSNAPSASGFYRNYSATGSGDTYTEFVDPGSSVPTSLSEQKQKTIALMMAHADQGKLSWQMGSGGERQAVKAYAAAMGFTMDDSNQGIFAIHGAKKQYLFQVVDKDGNVHMLGSGGPNQSWDGSKFKATGGAIRKFATAGMITGPGGATSDMVPIWASNGEYMHRASAVAKYGTSFMDSVNNGSYDPQMPNGVGSGTISNSTYNINVTVNNEDAQGIANTVVTAIKRLPGMTESNRRVVV